MVQIKDERDLVPLLLREFPAREATIRDRTEAEQWTVYGVVGGIWFDLIEPALVAEDQTELQACFKLVVHLIAYGSELIRGAVFFRVTPFLLPWQRRWAHLMGPLLLEDQEIART